MIAALWTKIMASWWTLTFHTDAPWIPRFWTVVIVGGLSCLTMAGILGLRDKWRARKRRAKP